MIKNCSLVLLGNLLGSVAYGVLVAITLTHAFTTPPTGIAAKLIAVAGAKTLGYQALGLAGFVTCFVKAMLCNWMVCLATVVAMTSTATTGKIIAAWLPIVVFFAQGFEHLVVNFFIIPTGMMLGAKITIFDWLIWNATPVLFGNIVGGFGFTGLAIYWTYRRGARTLARETPTTAPANPETSAA